jgi:hypothetical protein
MSYSYIFLEVFLRASALASNSPKPVEMFLGRLLSFCFWMFFFNLIEPERSGWVQD